MAARTILVPLDGSWFGERALPLAERLARDTGSVLHLVRVHVPQTQPPISLEGMPVSDPQQDALRWDAERAYLTRISRELESRSGARTRIAVLDAPVADALADYAAVNQIGLIVMSTHGRGGLGRAWMGSVADDLLRRSPAPVLLVRSADDRPAVPEGPPRILIALDGSPLAEGILEHALALGRPLGARYSLLLVVNPLALMGDLPIVLPPGMVSGGAAAHVAEARTYLAERARSWQDLGLEVETKVVESERIADAILTEAARQGCAFVAMATHGRSGLSRIVLGSVASQVVHQATTPVLLYRPGAHRGRGTEPTGVLAAACG